MRLLTVSFAAATLLGCGSVVCKSEQENAASVMRATARKIQERNATRLDLTSVVLRTTCTTRTQPLDGHGTFEGWTEPIAIDCNDVAPFINQAKLLEALTASGKRVLIVRASVENAVTVARAAPDRLLLFRAEPDKMHVRVITQCGRCSGLSDEWRHVPEVWSISAFVLEGWTSSSVEWVEFS